MNLNASALGFLTFACYAIIFGFFWRYVSVKMSNTPLGKAMGTLF